MAPYCPTISTRWLSNFKFTKRRELTIKSKKWESRFMVCWFLKEYEIYSVLTSQKIQNIHSTTEESSECVFIFIGLPAAIVVESSAAVECKTHTTCRKPRCLWKSMILTSSQVKTQLEVDPGSPFLSYNWSIDCIFLASSDQGLYIAPHRAFRSAFWRHWWLKLT